MSAVDPTRSQPDPAAEPISEPAAPESAQALLAEFEAAEGTKLPWYALFDSDCSTRKLADKLLADGALTADDAKALVADAKDDQRITPLEKRVFAELLRTHRDKIAPEAREALCLFFGLPASRPVVAAAFPGEIQVVEGTSSYKLDDDVLIMTGDGEFSSTLKREIYSAGYLPMSKGPLREPLGSSFGSSTVVSEGDAQLNAKAPPVRRFDVAFERGRGRPPQAGSLEASYESSGVNPKAGDWWGFCDRWAYAALDPEIASRVNAPVLYKGVYFSTAELRGLATFVSSYTGSSNKLIDKDVTPLDLQKAVTLFLKENGPGFFGDVWLDDAHWFKKVEVWNQPFDGVDQKVVELTGKDAQKILQSEFGLADEASWDKRVFYVETVGYYGLEGPDDNYEGPPKHETKTWKTHVLTDNAGKALDGKWASGSDDALEWIFRPGTDVPHSEHALFFRDMIKAAVPVTKTAAFEKALADLPAEPVAAEARAQLVDRFKGVALAYAEADLAAKLAPYGLTVEELS